VKGIPYLAKGRDQLGPAVPAAAAPAVLQPNP
jgi:hypothetical protein